MSHVELPVKSANPLQGSGVPDDSLGVDGNLYINTDNGKLYFKMTGFWIENSAAALPIPTQSLQESYYAGSSIVTAAAPVSITMADTNANDALHIIGAPDDTGGGETSGCALRINYTPTVTSNDYAVNISAAANSAGGLYVTANSGPGAAYTSQSASPAQLAINNNTGAAIDASTVSGTGIGAIIRAKASAAHLRLDAQTAGSISVKLPATVTTHSLTLPAAQGVVNSFLQNDGSGGLSWASATSLQSAYSAGPAVTVTAATGTVGLSGADGVDVLTLTKTAGTGRALMVTKSATGSTAAVTLQTSGSATATALQVIGGSSGTSSPIVVSNNSALTAGIHVNSTVAGIGLDLYHNNATYPAVHVRNLNTAGSLFGLFGSTAGQINIRVPNSITTYTLNLPSAQGLSDSYMRNDGSGNLTWVQAAAANGLATLDGGGKIPSSQLPSSLLTLEGVWNASTNTPALADGTGDPGMVYLVTVAGSQNLGSGSQSFAVGDWVLYNASGIWQQSNNSTSVASVQGYTGVVTLTKSDLSLGNVDNTSDATKNAASVLLTNKQLQDTTTSIVDSVDNTIAIKFDATGTTGTSTTLRSNQAVNAILDLPDATDRLIGRVSQDQGAGRLKNKDIEDSSFAIVDTADPTKKVLFDVDGVTGTYSQLQFAPTVNRTYTFPNVSGDVGIVPVALGPVRSTGSQLTTGYTQLGSEVSGTLPIANGGTGATVANVAFGALSPMAIDGDLITQAAGLPVRLPIGPNGQVLTVVSGAPTWSAATSVPLGAVLATFPNLTGAYVCTATTAADSSGFVTCGGQTISDGSSPMNGVVIPNINNNVFIRGNSTAGSSGGAASVTLTMSEIPQHNHGASGLSVSGSNSSSGISGSISGDGAHTHSFATAVGGNNNAMWHNSGGAPAAGDSQTNGSTTISSSGTHSHSASGLTANAQSWSGSVSGSTANAGTASPSAISIIPTYITARYIMRIK